MNLTSTQIDIELPEKWQIAPDNPYFIRRFHPGYRRDVETVELMEKHPALADMPEEEDSPIDSMSYEEMLSLRGEFSQLDKVEDTNSLFAVVDTESHVVGLIWYYVESEYMFPAEEAAKHGFDDGNTLLLQVSYYKLMCSGWSDHVMRGIKTIPPDFLCKERKGVIVNGIYQTMPYLRKQENERAIRAGSTARRIVVYGYTHPTNIASEKVLEKNDFVQASSHYDYDGDPHKLWFKEI